MLCIQCGTQNPDSTRFCTRCGANLGNLLQLMNAEDEENDSAFQGLIGPRHVSLILIISALVSIVGLVGIFILIGVLASEPTRINEHDLAPMLFFTGIGGLASICIIVKLLLGMIPKGKPASKKLSEKKKSKAQPAVKIGVLPPQSVESFTSVVEHTTARLPEYGPPANPEGEPRRHTK